MVALLDESAVRLLVDQLAEGWNAQDGSMFARPFADDADFMAITGLRARGRDLIAAGHNEIFSTVYRGTKNRPRIDSIRFIRPDVAIVQVTFTLEYDNGKPFPMRPGLATLVATCDDGVWSIRMFHNMIPFERPAAGPLEKQILDSP